MSTNLQVGVVSRGMAPTRSEWHDRVRRWESDGFDRLLMPDHLGIWPPLIPLVSAAEVTSTMRLGTQVLNNEFWNPALLAREAAAADVLTDGRIELGFGAGYTRSEFDAVGIELASAGRRIARLGATLVAVRGLLAGETVTDAGLGLDEASIGFSASQQRLPLLVGGNGDRLLTVAARHADVVQLIGVTSTDTPAAPHVTHFGWDGLADRIAFVRAAAGRRSPEIAISVLLHVVSVTDDPRAATEHLARTRGIDPADVVNSPFCLVGPAPALAEQLDRLHTDLGINAVTVMEEHAPAMVQVLSASRT